MSVDGKSPDELLEIIKVALRDNHRKLNRWAMDQDKTSLAHQWYLDDLQAIADAEQAADILVNIIKYLRMT